MGPGSAQRAHSEARVDNGACGTCHRQIDPLGWGLERFDSLGRYQRTDTNGNPLKLEGWFQEPVSGAKINYSTFIDYTDGIANSQEAQDCLIVKPSQYAFATTFDLSNQNHACILEEIRRSSGGSATASYTELLKAIALSKAFRE